MQMTPRCYHCGSQDCRMGKSYFQRVLVTCSECFIVPLFIGNPDIAMKHKTMLKVLHACANILRHTLISTKHTYFCTQIITTVCGCTTWTTVLDYGEKTGPGAAFFWNLGPCSVRGRFVFGLRCSKLDPCWFPLNQFNVFYLFLPNPLKLCRVVDMKIDQKLGFSVYLISPVICMISKFDLCSYFYCDQYFWKRP